MLKRVLCGLLAIVMLLSMVGCAGGNNLTPTNPTQPTGEATEPSGNVTEPTVDVTDPTIENGVTEPSAEATEPSEEATEPPVSDAPTEAPTEKPTEAPTEHVHSYTSKIVAPTCTEKGYTKYTCECGDSYKEDYVDKLEHTYTSKVVKPTCEAKGYTKYTCECGESYKEDYVAKIDHIYEGNKCTMCGEKKSGPINGMDIVKEAVQYIGLEYVYGGNSLTKGTDCSGFTSLIYKKYGISLPRTAAEQSKVGKKVTLAEAKPGDLYAVKYEDDSKYTGHAGFYIGNGLLLSAWPGMGVCVTTVSESDTFRRVFENSYEGTDEKILEEIHAHCFKLGMFGECMRVLFDPITGEIIMDGVSPLDNLETYGETYTNLGLTVNLSDIPKGYEALADAWKKDIEKGNKNFGIKAHGKYWGYYEGQWYLCSQLDDMPPPIPGYASTFCGIIWDSDSTITNCFDEVVDLSTFPKEYPATTEE